MTGSIESDTQVLSQPIRERIYRRNFKYFLTDSILFSMAMGILNPATVIPDFVRHLTDSEILIGFSGNLFLAFFALPQLLIARYIVRQQRKKWWFVGPNIPVRFVMLIFALITIWLGKNQPDLILLAFFICYGIAALGDGLVGVPWADLAGSSLNDRWRARMFGITNASKGLLTLLLVPLIGIILGDAGPGFPNNYALLFGVGGVLFVLSILPGVFIHELPSGKVSERHQTLREFLPDLGHVLRDDVPFRAYIITRMFTSLFLMALPFYIGYATVQLGLSSEVAVPVLLAMQTVGVVVGSIIYAWLGARNEVLYIQLSLAGASLLPVCALLAGIFGPLLLYIGFLVAGLTITNLFFSYLNWLVGYAHPDQRPIYVGLANTVAAMIALIAPVIGGTIVQTLGYRPLFIFSLLMTLSALYMTLRYLRNTRIGEPREVVADSSAT